MYPRDLHLLQNHGSKVMHMHKLCMSHPLTKKGGRFLHRSVNIAICFKNCFIKLLPGMKVCAFCLYLILMAHFFNFVFVFSSFFFFLFPFFFLFIFKHLLSVFLLSVYFLLCISAWLAIDVMLIARDKQRSNTDPVLELSASFFYSFLKIVHILTLKNTKSTNQTQAVLAYNCY